MPLSEGTYFATRTGQSVGETKNNKVQIVIEFDATHIARNGEWEALPTKTPRKVFISCSDAAWPYSKPKLEAMGFNGRFDDGIDFSVNEFEIECKHEEYEGKLREKWEFPYGGGAVEMKPIAKPTALRLSTLWKAGAAQTPKPKGKPAAPPVAATAPSDGPGDSEDGPPGDNIPF